MVRLSKIYTKVGDAGDTMLGDGSMASKCHARVEAYGSVDEANATIGAVVWALEAMGPGVSSLTGELLRIQNELFDVGADLCVPLAPTERPGDRLRITPAEVLRLEQSIDRHNASLPPLNSFVLPGGTGEAVQFHLARTTVRRAERRVAALLAAEPDRTNPQTLVYLNRLSDLLFVLARAANSRGGGSDVLWVPGAGRGPNQAAT